MKRTLTIGAFLHLYIFTFCALAQDVFLRGNIVKTTTQLQAEGDNMYRGEVTLDDSNVFLFSDKYVYFECPSTGYKSGNIRINGGKYTATFNLATKAWTFEAPTDEYRISAFGSSVCNGQGATGNKGYAWMYGEQLKERSTQGLSDNAFYVSGIAIGGNTTQNLLDRYAEMTRDHSRYVIIGLSMANEGLHESTNKQEILTRFANNMQTLMQKIKADGKVPVVMNNYTRADYTEEDYSFIKQINMQIHQWNVTSVNTLGAIDDGHGRWASGYQQDNGHPTTNGHREFFYAMTPSLFDAIKSGKAQPVRDRNKQMTLADGNTIQFAGEGTVHPFTVTLRVRGNAEGRLLTGNFKTGNRTLNIAVTADGHVVYTSGTNKTLTSQNTIDNTQWHYVTLTHYYAQGRTLLYVDGQPAVDANAAGELRERISPLARFVIGEETTTTVSRELGELFFWRAAMCPEEIAAVEQGKMLKSSLELYIPTAGSTSLANKAMSLNEVEYVEAASQGITTMNHRPSRPSAKYANRTYDLSGRLATARKHQVVIRNGLLVMDN